MSYLIEFLIVASILVVLTRHKRLRDWGRALPSKLRLGLIGLMALMLAGQFTRSSELTFPFVFWGMYTKQVHFATRFHAEVEAKTTDGRSISINPSRLYPSLGFGSLRIHNRVHHMALRASRSDYLPLEKDMQVLRSFATTYEKLNPEINLEEISLLWIILPFSKTNQSSEIVLTVQLGS